MAITFGSFGDIIAAVQVACKLIEILSAQRGTKREFRDLIVDLRLFHRFLDQVWLLQNHEAVDRVALMESQLLSFWQTRE